jgi:hypothetical protein
LCAVVRTPTRSHYRIDRSPTVTALPDPIGPKEAPESARGIGKLFENGWGAVVVGDSEAVMCWLVVGLHAAAAAVISSQTSKRSAISLRHWGALTR